MRQNSFNVVGLAIALFVVIVAVALLIPAINAARHTDTRRPRSSQLRGIHQGLVTYSNSNKNWYPGMNPDGTPLDLRVEHRFQILIKGDYITPEYAISPSETEPLTGWEDRKTHLTKGNYSYAMLQIPEAETGRHSEWHITLNSQAIVLSDRNTGAKANPKSIYNERGDKTWTGSVLWNDNHVGFEDTDEYETKYGGGELNEADKLFESTGPNDALLIHSGN